ncbi:universal stress protein [Herbidospora mongoliensis]|uniref:universal stress protein n=1 Tax=Herbidospora mongoliensis TaxID=688067 RepID=UPI00082FE9DA|nr:universal stress protein [Herbidospora mongoliensis]
MNILTGYTPDLRGRDALALTGVISTALSARVTVANVRPATWETPGPGKVDAEWKAYLRAQQESAMSAAARAAEESGLSDVEAATTAHHSSGLGLIRLSSQEDCDLIVIGSAPHGPHDRIAVGSTADQLLHCSRSPVGIAPKGYSIDPPTTLTRLTFAYFKSPTCEDALLLAIRAAGKLQLPLRLISVLLKERGTARVEEDVLEEVHAQYERDLRAAVRGPRRTAALHQGVSTEVVAGPNASKALAETAWIPGELMVCGSSSAGPLRRVFVGDMSLKILRAAPCPVVVLPRSVTH